LGQRGILGIGCLVGQRRFVGLCGVLGQRGILGQFHPGREVTVREITADRV